MVSVDTEQKQVERLATPVGCERSAWNRTAVVLERAG